MQFYRLYLYYERTSVLRVLLFSVKLYLYTGKGYLDTKESKTWVKAKRDFEKPK